MQPRKVEAIILRRTNYGEADRILSLLTSDSGKVNAIARGVRRPKSKLAGGLELFAVSDITMVQGRGDLALVTSARIKQFFGNILHDYDRLQLGYDIVKNINRITETVSEPEFYRLLRDSLAYLNDLATDWRVVELWFHLQHRALLGSGLNSTTDREGEKLQQSLAYNYDTAEHAFYAHPAGTFTSDHIKLLRLASVKTPHALRHIGGLEKILPACLALVREL